MVILYIVHFSKSPSENPVDEVPVDSLAVADESPQKTGRIYYVNTDSVWNNYEFVIKATKDLESRKDQLEGQLEREVKQFEQEVTDFRTKGPSMSDVEVQIKQRDLMRKEAELQKLGEELETKFLMEEKGWNDKLRSKIIEYIKGHMNDRPYDYVLGYSLTSNIIIANDSLDLTGEIIQGLNTEYAKETSSK